MGKVIKVPVSYIRTFSRVFVSSDELWDSALKLAFREPYSGLDLEHALAVAVYDKGVRKPK